MTAKNEVASSLSRIVAWVDAISEERPGDEVVFQIRNLDNPGWEVSLDAGDTGFDPGAVPRRKELSEDGSWLTVAPDGPWLRIACGPKGVGPALEAMLAVIGSFEETRHD